MTKTPAATPVTDANSVVLDETSTDRLVRAWVAQHLSNGHIARSVDMWNELQSALPALVKMIEA